MITSNIGINATPINNNEYYLNTAFDANHLDDDGELTNEAAVVYLHLNIARLLADKLYDNGFLHTNTISVSNVSLSNYDATIDMDLDTDKLISWVIDNDVDVWNRIKPHHSCASGYVPYAVLNSKTEMVYELRDGNVLVFQTVLGALLDIKGWASVIVDKAEYDVDIIESDVTRLLSK